MTTKKAINKAPAKQTVKKVLTEQELRNIPLGTKMRDIVTGFEGIAVAKIVFLNQCVQYQLKSTKLDKDGKVYEGNTFDCQQLEYVDDGIIKKEDKPKTPTGGDMPDFPKLSQRVI